jgi:RimJ/RimL family protein N-acetyltransferase
MFIRSERLFLRPGWPEDADELRPLIADREVASRLTAPPLHDAVDCAGEWLEPARDPLLPRFCVTLPSALGAKLVGWIGLRRESGQASLSAWIGRPFWGQGYASEAARAVLGLARALGHRRLVAEHFDDDPASARVLARLGFEPTGEARARLSWARSGNATVIARALALEPPIGGDNDPEIINPPMRAA